MFNSRHTHVQGSYYMFNRCRVNFQYLLLGVPMCAVRNSKLCQSYNKVAPHMFAHLRFLTSLHVTHTIPSPTPPLLPLPSPTFVWYASHAHFLSYVFVMLRMHSKLSKVTPVARGRSILEAVDPAIFEVLGVRSLGHKLLLSQKMLALYEDSLKIIECVHLRPYY